MSNKKREQAPEKLALSTRYDKYSTYLAELQEGTQNHTILKHLIEHGQITSIEAFFDYWITRIGARIYDLRSMGIDIETNIVTKKSEKGARQSYAIYSLKDEKEKQA